MTETVSERKRNPWWVWALVVSGVVLFLQVPVSVLLFYLGWWPFDG